MPVVGRVSNSIGTIVIDSSTGTTDTINLSDGDVSGCNRVF